MMAFKHLQNTLANTSVSAKKPIPPPVTLEQRLMQ